VKTTDLTTAKRTELPEVWSFHKGTNTMLFGQIAEPSWEGDCAVRRIEQPGTKKPSWAMTRNGEEILLLPANTINGDKSFSAVLRAKNGKIEGDLLTFEHPITWERHPKLTSAIDGLAVAVRKSWEPGIEFREEVRDANNAATKTGLRSAQIGALHAVAAHWVVSSKPALVVMPTGTGKTEVMLACMVMSNPERLLVLVPSDALRLQTFDKFCWLGILQAIGVVPGTAQRPVVGMLKGKPEAQELDWIRKCNVLVTTVAAIQDLGAAELKQLMGLFDQLYFDEAHHLPSSSWKRISDAAEGRKILQLTATPFRLDGQRMPGRIIFSFPLKMAQKQGYFRKIHFQEVSETDTAMGDAKIAALAVAQLRKDQAVGLQHIVLARADTMKRAEEIYENHYKQYADLSPAVIHSKTRGHRQLLRDIKAGKHQIVVCVDMFGEGFDLPTLKIAALHEPHRSLAIALQFTGRFTRDATGIGDATVIANTADPRVSEAIEELYAEDADWNTLIPQLSAKAIQSQMNFSDFLERMDNKLELDEDIFGLNVLQPKISTVIYQAAEFSPTRFKRWAGGSHVERDWVSKDKDLVIFITKNHSLIEWATIKETSNETWNLFIVAYDQSQKLLFIHSSQKGSLYPELAKAVSGDGVRLLEGEKMFRAFHGLSRLIFYNAGLYNKGSKLRFRMYCGLDIAEAIQPSAQANARKSNLFGIGYDNGETMSVGVSYKGRVWSMSSGSVPDWLEWCKRIGRKIQDTQIPTDSYLEHTLLPKEIAKLPETELLMVALPPSWYTETETIRLYEAGKEEAAYAFEIKSFAKKDSETVEVEVGWDGGTPATLKLAWGKEEGEFKVSQTAGPNLEISIKGTRKGLADYLTESPPTLYFINGSEAHGGRLLESPKTLQPVFEPGRIVAFSWTGVDIEKESKWKNGTMRKDTVQGKWIDHLKIQNNQIVFDDDDAGEVADIVEIAETNDTVTFKLYHCKYSAGGEAGKRVKDPAEVCMQAARSIRWLMNPAGLVKRLLDREAHYLKGRPTRFEKGNKKMLSGLRRRLKRLHVKSEIFVVQPGISKAQFNAQTSTMLAAAHNLIQDMTGNGLTVIASP
jgi:superfamily II DNA or RNA helicase